MKRLRLIAFSRPPGLVAASRNGYFQAEGLEVEYTQTRGSVEQIRGLLAGQWDLAHTAVDNVLAYVDGENADLFVFFIGDLGANQKVVVRPNISSFDDLRGKTLGLDAIATGYAFMLYKILALNGVGRDGYRTVSVGGTAERLAALLEGSIDCAILNPPHDERAVAAGCRVLTPAASYFPGYPGLTAATRRAWAAEHRQSLVGYSRALLNGLRWSARPENRAAVIQQIAEDQSGSPASAEKYYELEVAGREKIVPNVSEMEAAIRRVADLRREMSGTGSSAGGAFEVSRYFDPSFLVEADATLAVERAAT